MPPTRNGNGYKGLLPDPIVSNMRQELAASLGRIESQVQNFLVASRSRLPSTGQEVDPRRNINDECGFPNTESILLEHYREYYDREPVATRVVDVMPLESWCVAPEIRESEDPEKTTAFEQGWKDLAVMLRDGSKFKSEESHPIWEYCLRVDKLCGIGSYGLLLLGLDDGKELSEPAEKGKSRKLNYVRPFSEDQVEIVEWERDTKNPRYGQPAVYSVQLNSAIEQSSRMGTSLDTSTQRVHWTRVIHVPNENLGSSEVFGVPRMRSVFNCLYNLRKLYHGSAEMYWKGAFFGLSFETHPQLGGDVSIDKSAFREELEQWQNGLQRFLISAGITAKPLAPAISDPTPQINVQIEAICIKLGIPKRIFLGSERGELASSQDEGSWNDVIRGRQNGFVTPRVVVPLVDRLMWLGILPEPEQYTVVWPDLDALTDQEKAQIAQVRTQALSAYVGGGVEAMISPLDYLTTVLGLGDEESKAILQATEDRVEEEDTGSSPLLSLVSGLTGIVELFKAVKDGAMTEEQLKQVLMLFFKLPERKADDMIADGFEELKAEEERELALSKPPQPPPLGQSPNQPPEQSAPQPPVAKEGVPGAKSPFPQPSANAFCPTGPGGGVDPSCSPGGLGPKGTPLRKKTPSHGYHVTGIENLESIAKSGLVPGISTTGGGGQTEDAAIYFGDKLGTTEDLSEFDVMLKAKIPRGLAWDDTEVREYEGLSQDPNKDIGDRSAFLIAQPVPPSGLSVVIRETGKTVPLAKYVKSDEYRSLLARSVSKPTSSPPRRVDAKLTPGGKKTATITVKDVPGDPGNIWVEYKGQLLGMFSESCISGPWPAGEYLAREIKDADRKASKGTMNVFCPTGVKGGIDPACSPGGAKSSPSFKGKPANPRGGDTLQQYRKPDGSWTKERQALHDEIVAKHFAGKTPVDEPTAYMLGGGTASGKSRMRRTGAFAVPDNAVAIDPDEIKKQLPEFQSMTAKGDAKAAAFVHEESAYLSRRITHEAAGGSYNTLLDGTGDSSIDKLTMKVGEMRARGQRVVAAYATTSLENAIQRERIRAQKPPYRKVPEAVLRHTHAEVSRVLPQAVQRGLFDELSVYDTTSQPKLLATARGAKLRVHDSKGWQAFLNKGK